MILISYNHFIGIRYNNYQDKTIQKKKIQRNCFKYFLKLIN